MIRVLRSDKDDADPGHVHDARREDAGVNEEPLAAHVDEQARVSEMRDPHDQRLGASLPPLPELLREVGRSHTGKNEEVCRQRHSTVGKTQETER